MGYSEDPSMVRVDFFRESGKWYTTEAVKWLIWEGTPENLIYDAFREALKNHFKKTPGRLDGMWAVCLKPWHEHKHPLMIKVQFSLL